AMLFGTDTLSLGYVARDFFARALERGAFPLWNPLILGGTPFLESLAGGDSLYPPSVALLLVTETYRALGWKLVLHVFLAGIFTYGWLRILDRSRVASFLGGLAYLVAPFSVTLVYPGHDGKLFVTALTPLLFWVTEWAFRERGLVRALLPWVAVSFVVGLVILTTHFQMAYFLFGAVGLYAIFRTVQIGLGRGPGAPSEARGGEEVTEEDAPESTEGREAGETQPGWRPALSRFGLFLTASILGASLAGVQLIPSVEYVLESSRRTATTVQADEAGSVAYSSSWSLHPEEIMSLVVPEFVGSNVGGAEWTTDTYWGRNPFKLNHEYAGLVVLILAGLAFLGGVKGRGERGSPADGRSDLRWFLLGLGLLAILYALGSHTPVWRIFYEVVPGVSLFRAPSMAIFLYGFAVITLAAFGIDRVLDVARRKPEGWRTGAERFVWIVAGIFGVLVLLSSAGVLTTVWTSLLYPELGEAKAQALQQAVPHITRGLFISALLVAVTGGLCWAYRSERIGARGLVAGLAFLLAVDGIRVDEPFIQTFDFHRWAAPTANMQFLQARQAEEPPFRVFSMEQGGQDVKPALYGLELAAGHHPNDLARYRELIGMEGSGIPQNLLQSTNVLRILNVRYLLWPDRQFGPVEGMPRVSSVEGPTGQPLRSVYEVAALPRARLVGSARVVPGIAAVDTILSRGFDPAGEVVLPEEPPLELPGGPVEGSVEWVERSLNQMVLEVRNEAPALLVLADNWYPGWAARVDGAEAPVLRANHTLRAIPLEASGPDGEHRVEIFYDSTTLERSAFLSFGTLVLLLFAGGVSYVRRTRSPGADRGA
ncbi:MAG: hypothetical protein R3223_11390, partial [Longimicrobiales bacterium]|nr:hypothetical protein [Longimicrobiales bacterium]